VGRRLGDLAFLALRRRRRLALTNLALALPHLDAAERHRIGRRSFEHLGMVFTESCFIIHRPLPQVTALLTLDGTEHLEAVLREHGRALVLTAHLGNWEMLTLAPAMTGHPLSVVARALDSPMLDAWANGLRRKAGVEVIDKRDALRPVIAALRRGALVGVLLDQNASRREGVFVPFFGRLASTSRAVAVLALRTKTPVIPAFTRRLAPDRHCVSIGPAFPMPDGADEEALRTLTARCTAAVEEAVRATPEQWLWAHDRWRTRPAEDKA
jgi:KDO2-lipid IV(A) lauroyltransferase